MTTIDKKRYIEPAGPASFEQDGWLEQPIPGEILERLKARLSKFILAVVAGIILVFFCAVQFFMDMLERVCLACFGR
jgi:hypothetical protein